MPGSKEIVLYSWIHVSDIHMGHGNASHRWDQNFVLDALLADLEELLRKRLIPRPNAIFATGDVTFSGAASQYQAANTWLLKLAGACGLDLTNVFAVPGNHDIQRDVDRGNPGVARLVRAVRADNELLDDILADPDQRSLLSARLLEYLNFGRELASGAELHWTQDVNVAQRLRVRLVGLNTALLAADNDDRGVLQVGRQQLSSLPPRSDRSVTVVLTHHPTTGGWLRDEEDVAATIRAIAHVHLSGHVHQAATVRVEAGGGGALINVTAGAVHNEARGGLRESHGYNVAAIVLSENGALQLAVWPRRWSPANRCFRCDVDSVPDNQDRAVHAIPAPRMLSEANHIWKYTGQYCPVIHLIRQQLTGNAAQLAKAASEMQAKVLRLLDERCAGTTLEAHVAAVDSFRLAFKEEYDRRCLKAIGRGTAVPDHAMKKLLTDPYGFVPDLICLEVGSGLDQAITEAVCRALGGRPDPADSTRIILGTSLRFGDGAQQIEVSTVRLRAHQSNVLKPVRSWQSSVADANRRMDRFNRDPEYRRRLLEQNVTPASLFEYACCAFAGTAVDPESCDDMYTPSSNDQVDTELYAIDLWLEHTLHSLECANLRRISDVARNVEEGWEGAKQLKAQRPYRPLFWRGHVLGDLVKSMLFAHKDFRNSYPALPETLTAVATYTKN